MPPTAYLVFGVRREEPPKLEAPVGRKRNQAGDWGSGTAVFVVAITYSSSALDVPYIQKIFYRKELYPIRPFVYLFLVIVTEPD